MRTLARFVTRPSGNDMDSPPDLIIGTCYRNQPEDGLKAGRVYELRVIMGQYLLRDVGPTSIGITANDGLHSHACWSNCVSQILAVCGKHMLLTWNEMLEILGRDKHD